MCAMISGLFIGSNDGRPPNQYKDNLVFIGPFNNPIIKFKVLCLKRVNLFDTCGDVTPFCLLIFKSNNPLSTNLIALYGELGRFPLHIIRKVHIIKCWIKLLKEPDTSLIKQVYLMLKQIPIIILIIMARIGHHK